MTDHPPIVVLDRSDAGEILTLQRAAYVSEARAHRDMDLPPLTQTLEELVAELEAAEVVAYGIRIGTRLVAAARIRFDGVRGHLGRLIVAPDLQGRGLGSALLSGVESRIPRIVTELCLFTGEYSDGNLRLYQRFGYREVGRSPAGAYSLVHLVKSLSIQ